VLSLPPSVRVFVAVEAVDMRKSFDALALLVENVLRQDPLSGHLFVFVGKRGHIARILFWDRSGYALFSKRLEKGVFRFRRDAPVTGAAVQIDAAELLLLLEGIDLAGSRRRASWEPGKTA
jgi:transposase